VRPDDRVVLVAFGGLYMRVGVADYEFYVVTQDLPAGLIFLRDRSRRIYHNGLPELGRTFPEMADGLRRLIGDRRWVAVGNSGGGFAALLFGALAGADEVHAFAPVTFLDSKKRKRYKDDRFSLDIDRINADPNVQRRYLDVKPWMKRPLRPTRFHLYYADAYDMDRLHAERLKRIRGTTLHPRAGKGHGVIRQFALSGELKEILRNAVEADGTEGSSGPAS
jgi:pimeloyl-ACP methyl ester carboxylesterase